LGEKLRIYRKAKGLSLNVVAKSLSIDTAILSKIERGQRKANRQLVVQIAQYYKIDEKELLDTWIADRVYDIVKEESLAIQVLEVAEKKVAYGNLAKNENNILIRDKIINTIKCYFQNQNLVRKAWLFGSFARAESTSKSDIDVMIEVPSATKFTLFDLAEIKEKLELALKKNIDVVMRNGIREDIQQRIEKELILIYES